MKEFLVNTHTNIEKKNKHTYKIESEIRNIIRVVVVEIESRSLVCLSLRLTSETGHRAARLRCGSSPIRELVQCHKVDLTRCTRSHRREEHLVVSFAQEFQLLHAFMHKHAV